MMFLLFTNCRNKQKTSMEHQHLEKCFYISKLYCQPVEIETQGRERSQSQVQIVELGQSQCGPTQVKIQADNRHSGYFDRIFKMIKQKRAPSACVKTRLKSKKDKNSLKHSHVRYVSEFQQFFQGFIYPEDGQNYRRNKRKQTTNKWYFKHQTTLTQVDDHFQENKFQEEQEEEKEIRKLDKKLTYHKRMKQKICQKMDGIVAEKQSKKIRKIEMLDKDDESSVDKVLWMKGNSSKSVPKMRIIRSGLPVRLSELDAKVKAAGNTHLQDQKAKKDRAFYKVLQKNCEVVMSEIDNYIQSQKKKKLKKRPTTSKVKSSYLKQTCSVTMKKGALVDKVRKLMDDGDFYRWREKCVEIQQSFHQNKQSSKKISGGLKVFSGYCRHVNDKLSLDQNRLSSMLNKEEGSCMTDQYIF